MRNSYKANYLFKTLLLPLEIFVAKWLNARQLGPPSQVGTQNFLGDLFSLLQPTLDSCFLTSHFSRSLFLLNPGTVFSLLLQFVAFSFMFELILFSISGPMASHYTNFDSLFSLGFMLRKNLVL